MNRELDEQVALALGGWPAHKWIETWDGDLCQHCLKNNWEEDLTERCERWSPSTSHDAARMLEDEIEQRGLVESYVKALLSAMALFIVAAHDDLHCNPLIPPEIPGNRFKDIGNAFLWALIRATPEQRARAFLAAIEGTTL